jgi:hypothetical protein
MLKVPFNLRTLAFAHFGTSVANAVRSQPVYIASFGKPTFQIDYGIGHELTTRLSSTASSCLFIWRGIALTVLEAPSALVRKALFFITACLARVVTIDSFTHRLQSGLDLAVPACVGALKPPFWLFFSDASRRRHGKRKQGESVAAVLPCRSLQLYVKKSRMWIWKNTWTEDRGLLNSVWRNCTLSLSRRWSQSL